ncbi:MAG: phosphatase PAP2 family protein [Anaerolineae bacterium]|nr:MAG: phosphatase PAP2 family protein [Anaerolineae bacterium]
MHDFLMSLIPWGTEAIVWVQHFRTPALDSFFKALTFLGEEEFYLILMPLIYWVVDKSLGVRLVFAFLPGAYLTNWLKDLFFIPRPDPARVARLVEETTYAFPSGHAQNSTALFGFLAVHICRWFTWALATLLILGVALSRVYLGVHYPQDVVGGFVVGTIWLLLFLRLEKPARAWIGARSLAVRLSLAFLVPTLLVLLHPTQDTTTPMAALAGISVAYVLEKEWIGFKTDGPWWKRALRFVVGLVLVIIAYVGLKVILPEGLLFRYVRCSCGGLTAGLIAPWVFVRTKLATSEGGKEK